MPVDHKYWWTFCTKVLQPIQIRTPLSLRGVYGLSNSTGKSAKFMPGIVAWRMPSTQHARQITPSILLLPLPKARLPECSDRIRWVIWKHTAGTPRMINSEQVWSDSYRIVATDCIRQIVSAIMCPKFLLRMSHWDDIVLVNRLYFIPHRSAVIVLICP